MIPKAGVQGYHLGRLVGINVTKYALRACATTLALVVQWKNRDN